MKIIPFFRTIFKKHPGVFLLLTTPIAFVGIAIGVYTQKHNVILPEFLNYEKKMAVNQMSLVTQTIERQIHDLEMINRQWLKQKVVQAAFIDRKGFYYLSEAIESDTLENLFNIPLVQLVDAGGGILFTRGVNQNNLTNQAFKAFRNKVLSHSNDFRSKTSHNFWGIIPSPSDPIIICGSQYVEPKAQDVKGFFFLGSPLNLESVISRKNMDNIDIQIRLITDREKTAEKFSTGHPYRFDIFESHLIMTQVFYNPNHIPLLNIRIKMPRDINVPINKIARIAALTIIAVAICMWIYFAAAFLINRNLLNKKNKQIGLMLDQTEDRFSKIFQSRAVFVAITRIDNGEFLEVNSELLNATGYNKEEMIGKTTMDLGAFEDAKELQTFTQIIREKGFVRDYYLKLTTIDNQTIHVSVSSDLIDYKGHACLLNVLIDVTERKRLEADLKKSMFEASQAAADTEIKNYQLKMEMDQRNQAEKLNQVLFDISNAVNTTRDLDELYAGIHSILSTILPLDNFYIASYIRQEDRVTFPYWHDEKDGSSEDIDNISKKISLAIEVIKSGKPLLAGKKDFEPGGRFAHLGTGGKPVNVWLGVPLKIKGEVIGVMVTQSDTDPELFSEKDIDLLTMVSDQVANAIERKRSQDALLQSEIKHRSIIESVQDGYCETDLYGRIIFFNKAFCHITQYSENELSGKNFIELAEDLENPGEILKNEDERNETRIKIRQQKGQLKHIGIHPAPVFDADGEKIGYRTFVRDIDKQKKYEEKLVFLAYHDTLTGLYNRKAFYEHLTRILNQAKRDTASVALVFMDIDKFKKVNDTLGHEKGDSLLKEIASRLTEILRKTDYISRIGGDEFTIVMSSKAAFHPIELAERILEAIRLPYHLGRDTVDYVSTSIGVSIFPDDAAQDAEDLVHQADQAMYKAKEAGDTFVFFRDI